MFHQAQYHIRVANNFHILSFLESNFVFHVDMSLAVFFYIYRYIEQQDHSISWQDILDVIKHTYLFLKQKISKWRLCSIFPMTLLFLEGPRPDKKLL